MALNSKRLGKLLSLIRQQEEKRAQALAATLNAKKLAEEKKQQLSRFQHEYLQKVEGSESISMEQMLNHRQFLTHLETAVAQHSNRMQELENRLEPVYQAWLVERNRRQTIQDSKTQAEQDEHYLENRNEQKTLDDLSSRRGKKNQTVASLYAAENDVKQSRKRGLSDYIQSGESITNRGSNLAKRLHKLD